MATRTSTLTADITIGIPLDGCTFSDEWTPEHEAQEIAAALLVLAKRGYSSAFLVDHEVVTGEVPA